MAGPMVAKIYIGRDPGTAISGRGATRDTCREASDVLRFRFLIPNLLPL